MVKDREAWRAAVHGVPKSQTGLSDRTTIRRSNTCTELGVFKETRGSHVDVGAIGRSRASVVG